MNQLYFIIFFLTLFFVLWLSFLAIKKHPLIFMLSGIAVVMVGVFYGYGMVDFKDPLAIYVGNTILSLTSAIAGGIISCSYAEMRSKTTSK